MATCRLQAVRALVAIALGTAVIASCGVDQTGLGSMPFLPHDASSGDTTGIAGAGGHPGTAGASGAGGSVSGAAGNGAGGSVSGAAGDGAAGNPGAGGTIAGTGGSASGAAGDTGTAGANGGNGGNGGSTAGDGGVTGSGGSAGTTGTAGSGTGTGGSDAGAAGISGSAGTGGSAGVAGAGGSGNSAGTGGSAGTGVAGMGGRGGIGASGGFGGTGGTPIPCNSTTCSNGCCKDSTTCIRMRSAAQCGSNGATCMPCGGCQLCSGTGTCLIDGTSRWTVTAVSAQLKSAMWDRPMGEIGGALPDPFCEFENPAGSVSTTTAGVTDTVIDTLTPSWNQVITPAGMTVSAATLMSNNPTWQIWVGDDDGVLADVACSYRQPITASQLRAGALDIANLMSCTSLSLAFTCQP